MTAEITHRQEDGRMVQVVTPERLTEILREQGESLAKPKDFGPNDEWCVCDEPVAVEITCPECGPDEDPIPATDGH